jgi:hypothetical protein
MYNLTTFFPYPQISKSPAVLAGLAHLLYFGERDPRETQFLAPQVGTSFRKRGLSERQPYQDGKTGFLPNSSYYTITNSRGPGAGVTK